MAGVFAGTGEIGDLVVLESGGAELFVGEQKLFFVAFVRALRNGLTLEGFTIQPFA